MKKEAFLVAFVGLDATRRGSAMRASRWLPRRCPKRRRSSSSCETEDDSRQESGKDRLARCGDAKEIGRRLRSGLETMTKTLLACSE